MSRKHFFDDAHQLVLDALEGVTILNPEVCLDKVQKVIFSKSHDPSSQVALISGGGAGHEPAHAAFVGQGMLTAAVSGNIFASPSVSQILSAISRIGGEKGTILIIKNYTGDVFHFYLAAEKARAVIPKSKIHILVVADDASVGRKKSGKVGRRALAGTVLVHKILGSLSQNPGVTFEELVEIGEKVVAGLVTVGASLGHVYIPGQKVPVAPNDLDRDQIELGMGIHNEPGCKVLSPGPKLPELVEMMIDQLLRMDDPDRSYVDFIFNKPEEVVLLVNNLGGMAVIELSAVTRYVYRALVARGLKISRLLSGTFMTSLDGPGFSITLLKATPQMIDCIDSPVNVSGWTSRAIIPSPTSNNVSETSIEPELSEDQGKSAGFVEFDTTIFHDAVTAACNNLIRNEPNITHADSIVGDGDCGTTLKRGALQTLAFLDTGSVTSDAASTMLGLANVTENHMDGTSGAIFSIFFTAISSALRALPPQTELIGRQEWTKAVTRALIALQKATPARQGDRTLMDALEPFVEALKTGLTFQKSVERAREGYAATYGMVPAFGRAVYVEESGWEKVGDPGAEGVVCLLEGLATILV